MEIAISIAVTVALAAFVSLTRFRERVNTLETKIRRLRELSSKELEYRELAADDPSAAPLAAFDAELAAAGVTVLGTMVDVAEPVPSRWFVDRAGTSFGWVARIDHTHAAVVVSRRGDEVYQTRRSFAAVALAQPPWAHRQTVRTGLTLAELLAHHHELVGDRPELAQVASLADLARELTETRARNQAWRNAQDPAELLDRDLRGILGKHYDGPLGAKLARRLAVELPRARAL